jgi:hypothetical protein
MFRHMVSHSKSDIGIKILATAPGSQKLNKEVLKGLSHEMDWAFIDMYGYWLVLGLNWGGGHYLNFLVGQMIL